jgi:hypothetical protein
VKATYRVRKAYSASIGHIKSLFFLLFLLPFRREVRGVVI